MPAAPLHHLITTKNIDPAWLLQIMQAAAELKQAFQDGPASDAWDAYSTLLQRRMIACFFYEASTRTHKSFEAAMIHLGGQVIGTEAAGMFSSAAKGETIADTVRVIADYGVGAMVLRHTEKGSAEAAAKCKATSIINAGDGAGEHPTQALLDWFTIWEQFAGRTDLTMTVVGDLLYGRTVHSLIQLASELRGTNLGLIKQINLIAPEGLELPSTYRDMITTAGMSVTVSQELDSGLTADSDIVYMTRAQKERMGETEIVAGYELSAAMVRTMNTDSIVMHPLPRNAEIPTSVDRLPQARYFEQAQNGMFVRMAILLWVFGKLDEVLEM